MFRQCVEWLESGEKTPAELLDLFLARIREADASVKAWVDVRPQPGSAKGPLAGIPFGAKDILETSGLATEYGSPLYSGRKGSEDAAVIADLKKRGATLLGKTHTTAFAYFDPAPTRNPNAPGHTPGGSSSGSAAAVAAGMVPFTLGSQTQGSVLRPASFCGVTGFKPTFGQLPVDGVLPFAPSLDTVGLFTQTAADMRLLWERMGYGRAISNRATLAAPQPRPDAEPPMLRAFEDSIARLRARGWKVEDVAMPRAFAGILPAVRLVNNYEGARTHRERWERHGAQVGAKLAQLVSDGLKIPDGQYAAALDALRTARREMQPVLQEYAAVLTPAAPGPPPKGFASTGDPRMNSPWTALRVPAISIPMRVGANLPLGLQITGSSGSDARLLAVAEELEIALAEASAASPAGL
ncbi:MAG: amidase [Bryobacteraceae bacterium]